MRLIQSFVTKYIDDNNMIYEDDSNGKNKAGSGCKEVIAISIETDINM